MVSGTGDTDNGSFTITDDKILSGEVFDFETKSLYSIRVQTDDGNGGTFSKSFTIFITIIFITTTKFITKKYFFIII